MCVGNIDVRQKYKYDLMSAVQWDPWSDAHWDRTSGIQSGQMSDTKSDISSALCWDNAARNSAMCGA